MNQATLSLSIREDLGTKKVRKLRKESLVPGVLYGSKMESVSIQIPYGEMLKAYLQSGKHSAIELEVGGKNHLAMIKRIDIEPVKHKIQHVAFFAVKQNEKVQTEVTVKIKGEGETPAERAGLVLIKNVDTAEVEAFPRDLPEFLEVDGEKLAEPGDQITIADVVAPKGVKILSDEAQVIASAVEPAALQAANEPAEEEVESEAEEESTEAKEPTEESNEAKEAQEDSDDSKKQ